MELVMSPSGGEGPEGLINIQITDAFESLNIF